MAEITIFDWDLSKAFNQTPHHLPVPRLPVKVTLRPTPKAFKVVSQDPLLHQRIVDACKLVFVQAAGNINAQLMMADGQLAGASTDEAKKIVKTFEDRTRLTIAAAEKQAIDQAGRVYLQLAAQKKEYLAYQIKCGVKIGLGTLGLITAGAGIAAAAPSGGASLAVALVVATRSIIDGAKTLNNLCREAETIGKRVTKAIGYLAERHRQGRSRVLATGKEMLATAAKAAFVWEFDALKNIPMTKGDCDLWKNKLFGVRKTAHELARELNKLLELSDELNRKLLAAPHGSKEQKLRSALEKHSLEVMTLLGVGPEAEKREKGGVTGALARLTTSSSITREHLRAEEALRAQQAAQKMLEEMEKRSPGWVKYFDQFFPIAVNLGLGYSTASAPSAVMEGVAMGLSIGTDADGLMNEFFDLAGLYNVSEEISNLANAPAPGPVVSEPILTSTTADLGAMKLRPIGAPAPAAPVRPTTPLPPTPVRPSTSSTGPGIKPPIPVRPPTGAAPRGKPLPPIPPRKV